MESRRALEAERPLLGKRVLVTRAREQADSLARLLAEAGAEPVVAPLIHFEPPVRWDEVDRALSDLASYDWVVFTSANGVRFLLGRLEVLGRDAHALASARLAAIGPVTSAELSSVGLRTDLVPTEYVAEAVAEALAAVGVVGKRILVARAAEAREALVGLLRAAGAMVDEVPVYRTVGSPEAGALVRDLLAARRVDAVTLTSSSTAKNLVDALDGAVDLLAPVVVACIGPITAATARDLGLRVDVVAEEYTAPGLVLALLEHYEHYEHNRR
jgi:uroporphyrinogen III methyltransferase / synthase